MNKIADLRRKGGLSQSALGKIFNAAQNTISNWERGMREAPNAVMVDMADYFNVTLDYLLGRVEQDEIPTGSENDEHYRNMYKTFRNLTAENREKLLELADLYLLAQNK